MKSEVKTEVCDKYCKGCYEWTDKVEDWHQIGIELCKECNETYFDTTGFCSLSCCLGGGCDGSC